MAPEGCNPQGQVGTAGLFSRKWPDKEEVRGTRAVRRHGSPPPARSVRAALDPVQTERLRTSSEQQQIWDSDVTFGEVRKHC